MTTNSFPPLRALQVFEAVGRCGGVTEAAKRLGISPGAVSQQIKLLEEQVGFEVFDRRGRRIVLNAAGRGALPPPEAALGELDDGMRAAAALAALSHGVPRWTVPDA